jgi:uncharacterized membrane protein
MWILSWLPNWIFYGIFFAGLLGLLATYVMKFIPFVYVYRTPIQAISILAIAIGTYMSGAISNEEAWQARVKEMEAKVAAAEIESQKENVKIVERVVKKTEYITRKGQDIIKYVDREVVKYDTKFMPGGQCELPKEFIKALNDAAEPPK